MKRKIHSVIILVAMLAIVVLPVSVKAQPPISPKITTLEYTADPVRAECWNWGSGDCELPEGTVPFNVDMVDAEDLCVDGEGIYVAVLDTGLLSNYLNFFPEDKVDICEKYGKGFTHEWVEYDALNDEFIFGDLVDTRGFITHDDGAPDNFFGLGWGNGHGTHVTSIITGWQLDRNDDNDPDGTIDTSFWVPGVAPRVTIIPVLVLDDWFYYNSTDGYYYLLTGGTDEMVAAGIRYIGDLAKEHKIKIIINMSLGGSSPTELEEDAINYAISQGVIIIASAGNEGYDGMGWPGAFPQVISVAAAGWTQEYLRYGTGAADPWYWWTDDVPENLWTEDPLGNDFQVYLTDFSSRPNHELGQESWHLDVAAPGAAVKGPYKPYGPTQWGYYSVWGTSQAAPHVAGIAALVLDKYPYVNQYSMELCLKVAGFYNQLTKRREYERTATIYDIFSYDLLDQTWLWKDYGTGLLQADAALQVARCMFHHQYRHRRW